MFLGHVDSRNFLARLGGWIIANPVLCQIFAHVVRRIDFARGRVLIDRHDQFAASEPGQSTEPTGQEAAMGEIFRRIRYLMNRRRFDARIGKRQGVSSRNGGPSRA